MTNNTTLFSREPLWREHRRGSQHLMPEAVQGWVYETGSLTQRLRESYGKTVAVKILYHQWQRPYLDESRELQLCSGRYALIREVMLHRDGLPLLLARTVIPAETIKVAHRNLAHLGTRPLGEVIFSYPDLERISMDFTCVSPHYWSPLVRQEMGIVQPIWGRRTNYGIQNRMMLVSEFFLPEIMSS